jgi:hypothetical protein
MTALEKIAVGEQGPSLLGMATKFVTDLVAGTKAGDYKLANKAGYTDYLDALNAEARGDVLTPAYQQVKRTSKNLAWNIIRQVVDTRTPEGMAEAQRLANTNNKYTIGSDVYMFIAGVPQALTDFEDSLKQLQVYSPQLTGPAQATYNRKVAAVMEEMTKDITMPGGDPIFKFTGPVNGIHAMAAAVRQGYLHNFLADPKNFDAQGNLLPNVVPQLKEQAAKYTKTISAMQKFYGTATPGEAIGHATQQFGTDPIATMGVDQAGGKYLDLLSRKYVDPADMQKLVNANVIAYRRHGLPPGQAVTSAQVLADMMASYRGTPSTDVDSNMIGGSLSQNILSTYKDPRTTKLAAMYAAMKQADPANADARMSQILDDPKLMTNSKYFGMKFGSLFPHRGFITDKAIRGYASMPEAQNFLTNPDFIEKLVLQKATGVRTGMNDMLMTTQSISRNMLENPNLDLQDPNFIRSMAATKHNAQYNPEGVAEKMAEIQDSMNRYAQQNGHQNYKSLAYLTNLARAQKTFGSGVQTLAPNESLTGLRKMRGHYRDAEVADWASPDIYHSGLLQGVHNGLAQLSDNPGPEEVVKTFLLGQRTLDPKRLPGVSFARKVQDWTQKVEPIPQYTIQQGGVS